MDDNKSLLDSLTNTTLPALPTEPEPVEPTESREVSTVEERGKSPDEVVSAREARLPASEREESAQPPAKPEEKRYEVRGVKYTAKELEEAGLLEDLAVTHGKHQHLQEKYNELVAKDGKPVAKAPEAAQPQVPQITNGMIAKAYDQAATAIVSDLVSGNLMETDLPEAYPRAIQTLVGQLRYAFDLIFSNQDKLERMIAEVSGAKEKVQGQVIHNAYNQQLDSLVQKDAKLYAGLKDPKIRAAFTKYLVDELHATVGDTTGEKAPSFLAKQWVAFNSDAMIEATKNGVQDKNKTANKRLVVGEGTSSRSGVADTGETTLLDRLTTSSGKIAE